MDVRVLGTLQVLAGDEPAALGGPQRRAVLAFLLTRANQVVPTKELIDAVWWKGGTDRREGTLQTHVHALRKALEPERKRREPARVLVSPDNSSYTLRIAPEHTDEFQFVRALSEGRRALQSDDLGTAVRALSQACNLWRGEKAYADLASWPFTTPHVARLRQLRLDAREGLLDARLRLGQHAEVIGELTGLVAEEPMHEGLRAQLALALYRCDQQDDAVRVCSEGIALLREHGLDPGPMLAGCLHAILNHAPELRWTPRPSAIYPPQQPEISRAVFELPKDIKDFTGRDKQLRQILAYFERESARAPVVAIAGRPGVGKTTLAVHAAHRLRDQYPETLYADLGGPGSQPLRPEAVLNGFLLALGVPRVQIPEDLSSRAELYDRQLAQHELLFGGRTLVVIENAPDVASVAPLLPTSAGSAALVTSESQLDGLEAFHVVLDIMEPHEAVELLGKIAGADRVEADQATAQAIAGLCGYVPLAVRIAAARLATRPSWSLATLVDHLIDGRVRLNVLTDEDLPVKSSHTFSYNACRPVERRALRHLGLLEVPDFAPWVLAALLDVAEGDADVYARRLAKAQLLERFRDPATGGDRYRFHGLVRTFAGERLHDEEPGVVTSAALERVLRSYLTHVDRAAARLFPGDLPILARPEIRAVDVVDPERIDERTKDAPLWFEVERLNLVALIDQAYQADLLELTWLLATAAAPLLDLGSHWRSWEQTQEIALRAAQRARDQLAEAAILRNLARIAHFHGRFDEAFERFNRCLGIFRAIGHRFGEAYSLRDLGVLHQEQGGFDQAIGCLSESWSMFDVMGYDVGRATSLCSLGVAYQAQGRLQEAMNNLNVGLRIFSDIPNPLGESATKLAIATIHAEQGRFDDAVVGLRECVKRFEGLGRPRMQAQSLLRLGDLSERQGDLDESLRCVEASLEIVRKLCDRPWEARTLERLGDILALRGDHARARDHHHEALGIFNSLGATEASALARKLAR